MDSGFVVLDLELTGLDIEGGDRIISVGIVDSSAGCEKEWLVNPDGRESTERALAIHGLTTERLSREPLFLAIAPDVLSFIDGRTIVHHCHFREDGTSTDERAFNMELVNASFAGTSHAQWLNIKKWAIEMFPNANSLNDMLDRFGIENTRENKHHGGLSDARLTAQLYPKIRTFYNQHQNQKAQQQKCLNVPT